MPPRILIIEDDPTLVSQLQEGLDRAGYQTVDAKSWEEGFSAQADDPVALVIAGLEHLAKDSGAALQQLREQSTRARTAVIAIADTIARETVDLTEGLGVDSYVVRPVAIDALVERVEIVLHPGCRKASATWFVEDVPVDPLDIEFSDPEDPDSVTFR